MKKQKQNKKTQNYRPVGFSLVESTFLMSSVWATAELSSWENAKPYLVCSASASEASDAVLDRVLPVVLPRRDDVKSRMFSSTFDE